MKKSLSLIAVSLCLSGCVVPNQPVVYQGAVVEPEPVLVYPVEPWVGETVVIGGVPYYRHYVDGRVYYHHARHR